jgi:hypothetical protein
MNDYETACENEIQYYINNPNELLQLKKDIQIAILNFYIYRKLKYLNMASDLLIIFVSVSLHNWKSEFNLKPYAYMIHTQLLGKIIETTKIDYPLQNIRNDFKRAIISIESILSKTTEQSVINELYPKDKNIKMSELVIGYFKDGDGVYDFNKDIYESKRKYYYNKYLEILTDEVKAELYEYFKTKPKRKFLSYDIILINIKLYRLYNLKGFREFYEYNLIETKSDVSYLLRLETFNSIDHKLAYLPALIGMDNTEKLIHFLNGEPLLTPNTELYNKIKTSTNIDAHNIKKLNALKSNLFEIEENILHQQYEVIDKIKATKLKDKIEIFAKEYGIESKSEIYDTIYNYSIHNIINYYKRNKNKLLTFWLELHFYIYEDVGKNLLRINMFTEAVKLKLIRWIELKSKFLKLIVSLKEKY